MDGWGRGEEFHGIVIVLGGPSVFDGRTCSVEFRLRRGLGINMTGNSLSGAEEVLIGLSSDLSKSSADRFQSNVNIYYFRLLLFIEYACSRGASQFCPPFPRAAVTNNLVVVAHQTSKGDIWRLRVRAPP